MKQVLIVGDSISMGYTPPLQTLLAGEATAVRPDTNCMDSGFGLTQLDAWLAEAKWDVIHFNFGLHDLKYMDKAGNYVSPDKGVQVNPLPRYAENLKEVVARLKRSGAKLIWASTTPVPASCGGRIEGAEVAYNAAAKAVMDEAGILIDDLHAVVVAADMRRTPGDVHFTDEQYALLAEAVARSVRMALGA